MSTKDIENVKTDAVRKDLSCSTKVKFRTSSIRWTIEDYYFVSKTVKLLKSPVFPVDEEETPRWYIEFEPPEITQDNEKHFKIKLRGKFSNKIYILVTLSIESDSRKVFEFDTGRYLIDQNICISWNQVIGKRLHKELDWNEESDKNLIITCEVRTYDSTEHVYKKSSPQFHESNDLIQDISTFFADNETLQDVSIFVEDSKFGAHKAILAARSKVFEAMFSHEMSEKLNSSFEIKDLRPKTVETMLRFIYTDKVDNMDLKESAPELFAAAEKYDLKRLKEICITYMQKNVEIGNVSKMLEVADIYSILDLKKRALQFVASHRQNVKNLEEFKILIAERPHLMIEFLDILDDSDNQENPDHVLGETLEFHTDFK